MRYRFITVSWYTFNDGYRAESNPEFTLIDRRAHRPINLDGDLHLCRTRNRSWDTKGQIHGQSPPRHGLYSSTLAIDEDSNLQRLLSRM